MSARVLEEKGNGYAFATCRRQPAEPGFPHGRYNKFYSGRQRDPKYSDEARAICIIELRAAYGERLPIFAIEGDTTWMRIGDSLPARPCLDCAHVHGGRAFGLCLHVLDDGEVCPCLVNRQ